MKIHIEIEKKVCSLVEKALNIKGVDLSSSQENINQWDSLGYLSVLTEIENEFKIDITENNINNFGSVQNILNEVNHL